MPRWYSEGVAEFVAASEFTRDGEVSFGKPARKRYYELYRAHDISTEAVLDPEVYKKVHRGQMTPYLKALSKGNGQMAGVRGFGQRI